MDTAAMTHVLSQKVTPLKAIDTDTERAARAFLDKAAAHYDIAGAILFGSRARGDYRPDSDADIAVVLRGDMGDFLNTKLELADLAYDVLLDTAIHIQPLPIWEDQWQHPETHFNPILLRNIRCEGVPL